MRVLLALLLAAPLNVMTSLAQNAPTTTLGALRDTARPLLIFAGSDDAPTQQQLADLASHAAGVRDRDMRIVLVGAPGLAHGPSTLPVSTLAPADQQHARQRFHVPSGSFAVLLVGKDGGEKLRDSKPIPWQKLAVTIDGMPMRREEMQGR